MLTKTDAESVANGCLGCVGTLLVAVAVLAIACIGLITYIVVNSL